jgi:hypothetical protein
MPLFKNQWAAKNYPSSEDYLEAQRTGTLGAKGARYNSAAGAEPDVRRVESGNLNELENKGSKVTNRTHPQPKPFIGSLPKENKKGGTSYKILIFIIAMALSFLPTLSRFLDNLDLDNLWPSQQGADTSVATSEVLTADGSEPSQITTALPSVYFKILSPLTSSAESGFAELENLVKDKAATLEYGIGEGDKAFITIKTDNLEIPILNNSLFVTSEDSQTIFNESGVLNENASIELVLTDLTNDGLNEALLYFYNGVDYPFVEVFYNTGDPKNLLKPLEYFESYEELNITSKGVIQRMDIDGKVYDEIEITPEGAFIIDNASK